MANTKVTFTLDGTTMRALERASQRTGKAKSAVVREAIGEYADRIGRLGDRERRQMLRLFDEVIARIRPRTARATRKEIDDIRRLRRRGGRGATGRKEH